MGSWRFWVRYGVAAAVALVLAPAGRAGDRPKALKLRSVADARIGFTMDLPANVNAEACDAHRCVMTAPVGGAQVLMVTVTRAVHPATLAEAQEAIQAEETGNTVKASTLPAGHHLVTRRTADKDASVWYFFRGRSQALRANCRAPARLIADAEVVCRSLRSLR